MSKLSVRDKIVDAAFDRFHAKGFNDCSVQDIVDAAGVPKGSFYNYFKSKELLAIEIVERYSQFVLGLFAASHGSSPLGRLKAHFEDLADHYRKEDFKRGCLVGNFGTEVSDSTPDLRVALARSLTGWSDAIAAVLREAQTAGEVSADHDADRLARFIVDSWEGATTRVKVVNNRMPIDDFFIVIFDFAIR
jgi:TetR/AcrR family transcriptional regulator, transcriptional repressor for nem operon